MVAILSREGGEVGEGVRGGRGCADGGAKTRGMCWGGVRGWRGVVVVCGWEWGEVGGGEEEGGGKGWKDRFKYIVVHCIIWCDYACNNHKA